ncbi:GDSL esterase/lipase At5g03810 [Selaginella moellendorffii]|nr:GDSL esterase/lipase At5g03810 [Selaginella moellendorffii]|eukprot:XP_002971321.2 GDSL esterase/lipase At5g03810 [Selaginella moellendorffii]
MLLHGNCTNRARNYKVCSLFLLYYKHGQRCILVDAVENAGEAERSMKLWRWLVLSYFFLVGDASKVPALFVFGDSTVDTGNLKQRSSLSLLMTNRLPYGRDFVPPGPTGRASNGKLSTDFLAEFLELPSPANGFEEQTSGIFRGRNFAAGGSGYLNGTGALFRTIPLSTQLDAFEKLVKSTAQSLGTKAASELLAKSLFVVSTGNNDMFDYIYNIRTRFDYDPESYNKLVLSKALPQLERLYTLGARKMVVLSVGPLGCTPAVLTLYDSTGECMRAVNDQVASFNSALKASLASLASKLPALHAMYGNAYDLLLDAVEQPSKYGFKYGNVACCGLGRFGGSSACSNLTNVCSSADEHVFWDLVHPTQEMYRLVSDSLVSGPPSMASPLNISQLIAL